MKRESGKPVAMWFVAAVLLCAIASGFWPAFDLDEALYVRMAQEMRLSSHWVVPRWDGVDFLDKPPLYFWLIAGAQSLAVNVFGVAESSPLLTAASRIPSLVCGLATGALVGFGAYFRFLFPLASLGLVLLDGPLALALAVPLLIWWKALKKGGEHPEADSISRLTFKEACCAGVAISVALCLKGLVGLAIPGGAFALWVATSLPQGRSAVVQSFREAKALTLVPVALGVALAGVYYAWIGTQPGGRAFLVHFLFEEHFARGMRPREGHGGPFLYHFALVLLIGGPGLVALCTRAFRVRGVWTLPHVRFASAWIVFTLAFFGLMATKLPNYGWPIWPALALLSTAVNTAHTTHERRASLLARGIAAVPIAVLAALAFVLAGLSGTLFAFRGSAGALVSAAVAFLLDTLDGSLSATAAATATEVARGIAPFEPATLAAVFAAALCFAYAAWTSRGLGGSPTRAGIACALALALLGIGAAPRVRGIIEAPWVSLFAELQRQGIPTASVATLGFKSPTASRYLAPSGEPLLQLPLSAEVSSQQELRAIVVPVGSDEICERAGFLPQSRNLHLVLCTRNLPSGGLP